MVGLQKPSLKCAGAGYSCAWKRATIFEIPPVPILLGSKQHQLTPLRAGSEYS